MKKRIYISGPMSEIENHNRTNFECMASNLRTLGFLPIIPHDNGLPVTATYNAHMVRDFEMMLECDGIVLLEGWQHSRGASIEGFAADKIGLKIFFEGKSTEDELIEWASQTSNTTTP